MLETEKPQFQSWTKLQWRGAAPAIVNTRRQASIQGGERWLCRVHCNGAPSASLTASARRGRGVCDVCDSHEKRKQEQNVLRTPHGEQVDPRNKDRMSPLGVAHTRRQASTCSAPQVHTRRTQNVSRKSQRALSHTSKRHARHLRQAASDARPHSSARMLRAGPLACPPHPNHVCTNTHAPVSLSLSLSLALALAGAQ